MELPQPPREVQAVRAGFARVVAEVAGEGPTPRPTALLCGVAEAVSPSRRVIGVRAVE